MTNLAIKNKPLKKDVYQEITDFIIEYLENLENSENKFDHPFKIISQLPDNISSNNNYQGINTVTLSIMQWANNYSSNHWGTYKQWLSLGAKIKKGEKATPAIFYKTLKIKNKETGEIEKIPMPKRFVVFNEAQTEGYITKKERPVGEVKTLQDAEIFITNTKSTIKFNNSRAFYSPSEDFIQIPEKDQFYDTNKTATENYYSTVFHELTHWTGHSKRLNRIKPGINKTTEYAFEELIAELGSAFLCSQFNFSPKGREDHALYIKAWIKALKNDKKYIFKASSKAQQAINYLNKLQEGTQ